MSDRVILDHRSDAFQKYGVRELLGHGRKVLALAWNMDGRRLASGSQDKTIRIWNVEPHAGVAKPERAEAEFKGDKSSMDLVTSVAWKPDSADILASASASKLDTMVRFQDARTQKSIGGIALSSDKNTHLAWHPDGNALVVTCSNGDIVFLDYRKMKKQRLYNNPNYVNQVAWGPTPDRLTLALEDGSLRVTAMQRMDRDIHRVQAHMGWANTFAYSADYKWLASGGTDGIVTLFDAEDMICIKTFLRPDQPVRSVGFSHDASWLAYGSEDGTLDIVSPKTGELAVSMKYYSERGTTGMDALAWSPTAPVLAFAGEELLSRDGSTSGSVVIIAPPKA